MKLEKEPCCVGLSLLLSWSPHHCISDVVGMIASEGIANGHTGSMMTIPWERWSGYLLWMARKTTKYRSRVERGHVEDGDSCGLQHTQHTVTKGCQERQSCTTTQPPSRPIPSQPINNFYYFFFQQTGSGNPTEKKNSPFLCGCCCYCLPLCSIFELAW